MAGWLAVLALALAAFAFAALPLRLPRESYGLFAAALVFGIAGYAWQGSPEQPSSPKAPAIRGGGSGEAMVEARRALFDGTGPTTDYLVTSDGFARRDQFDDAAGLLRKGLSENPDHLEGWLALGMALVGHADGFVTPAAIHAFNRARVIEPDHPAADYFLGFAYLQSGEVRAARRVWGGLLNRSAEDAPWRDELEQRIAALDQMIANAPMLQ